MFRDAERAVLRQTPVAFPELGYLPGPAADLILWHRQVRPTQCPSFASKVVTKLMLDQDGLFAAVQPVPGVDEPRGGLGEGRGL